jgi:hypothetical protein
MSEVEAVALLRLRIAHDGRARMQLDRILETARLLVQGLADEGASDAEILALVASATGEAP